MGAGQVAEATLYLEPGSYVIICGIPGKTHQTLTPRLVCRRRCG